MRRHTRENLWVIGFACFIGIAIVEALNWMVPFEELWRAR